MSLVRLINSLDTIQQATLNKNALVKIKASSFNKAVASILYNNGLISSWAIEHNNKEFLANITINLKYRNGNCVLRKIKPVSLPSRKIYASIDDLKSIAAARKVGLVKGSVLGQVTILETVYGIVELDTALEKGVGGKVLAYAF